MPGKQLYRGRVFQFIISQTLAQNATFTIVPEELNDAARDYTPFNVVAVVNNSDENIEASFNDGQLVHTVFTKTQKVVNNVEIRNIKITNKSTTTTSADEISVEFQNEEPGIDVVASKIAQSSFFRKFFEPGLRGGVR